jgi:DNA-binding NtrC family response regulator
MCTVLVIDDDATTCEAIRQYLEAAGMAIETATDVHESRRWLMKTKFDAIVTDVFMPGNGRSVLDYARSIQPQTPVILVTSHATDDLRFLARHCGAFAVVEKMVATRELVPTLRAALTH